MGGGDLNMKKSWHPGLIKNRAQVWEDQHAALQERKRMEALRKEIEEERAANELQRLNEANGGAKRQERVEFLYAGPGAGAALSEDREAYLLGKKRIDDVFGKDSVISDPSKNQGAEVKVGSGINLRDVTTKVALDPLLAIKKQEAAQYEAMVNKKKAELEAAARKQARRDARKQRSGESSHRREEYRHHSDYRHVSDYRRTRDDRYASRSRSCSRDRKYRRKDDSRYEHKHNDDERYTKSMSHRRRERSPSRTESESESDYKRSRRRREHRRKSSVERTRHNERHASPRARSRSPQGRDRSPSGQLSHTVRKSAESAAQGVQSSIVEEDLVEEQQRATRLAEMSSSARDLDQDRLRRLELSKAKDDELRARETDDRIKGAMKSRNFVRDMQLSAGLVR